MKQNFLEAVSIIRRFAAEHLVDECGHLHGRSGSTQAIVRFLLRVGDAEYDNMLDPHGSGAVFQQNIKLSEKRADVPSPWHPIETAPKDGTEVLLFGGGRIAVAAWVRLEMPSGRHVWMVGESFPSGDYNNWIEFDSPTHWTELPNQNPPDDASPPP